MEDLLLSLIIISGNLLFLFLDVDITAAFNFTTLEGVEGTTVMVCAEITSLLILNTSVIFQVGVSEPSDVGKSIILYVMSQSIS